MMPLRNSDQISDLVSSTKLVSSIIVMEPDSMLLLDSAISQLKGQIAFQYFEKGSDGYKKMGGWVTLPRIPTIKSSQ